MKTAPVTSSDQDMALSMAPRFDMSGGSHSRVANRYVATTTSTRVASPNARPWVFDIDPPRSLWLHARSTHSARGSREPYRRSPFAVHRTGRALLARA